MIQGIEQVSKALPLSGENAVFSLNTHGLLTVSIPAIDYHGRAFLSLAFPFEREEEYLSVQTEEKEELGMIRALSDFDEATQQLLRDELKKKYSYRARVRLI